MGVTMQFRDFPECPFSSRDIRRSSGRPFWNFVRCAGEQRVAMCRQMPSSAFVSLEGTRYIRDEPLPGATVRLDITRCFSLVHADHIKRPLAIQHKVFDIGCRISRVPLQSKRPRSIPRPCSFG